MEETTFFELAVEPMLMYLFIHYMQQLNVLIPGVTVHQYIVEGHNDTTVQQVGGCIINRTYQCCRGSG